MNLPNQRRLMRAFIVSVLLGVLLYALSLAFTDLQAVGAALGALGIWGWIAILSLSLLNYALRFVRWQVYLGHLGHPIGPGINALYYIGGFAFTTTPGKAGEAVRSFYLKRHDVPYADSLAAFFVERLLDLVAIALLSALAVSAFEQTRLPIIVLAAVMVILLPLLRSPRLQHWLGAWSERLRGQRLKDLIGHFLRLLGQSSQILRNRPLYLGLALGLTAWAAEGFGLYLIVDFMGVEIDPMLAVGIYSVSVLIGALSFIPGGLGSTEATMALLLGLAGADAATALSATLVCRLVTLWFAVIIGLGCLGTLELPFFRHGPSTTNV